CWCHSRVAEHSKTTHYHYEYLNAQHQQASKTIRQTANWPLPDNPGADHHRHPETNPGITHALMIQVERHQAIERAEHNSGDNAAINTQTRLSEPQHRPDMGHLLVFAALVYDARKQQRQDRS